VPSPLIDTAIESMTRPRVALRLEGAIAAAAAGTAYFHYGHPWWLFLALLLAPDVSFAGYAGGQRLGVAVYNAAHAYVGPLILLTYGSVAGNGAAVAVALVWVVHIGGDRALGFGLKYPTALKETHLDRV
jgi:hypothetical protein